MYGLLPIFLLFISAIIWILIRFTCARKSTDFKLWRYILVSGFVFTFLLYPDITRQAFSLFDCYNYENGNSYLKKDLSIQCWSGSHLKLALSIGLPMLILWTLLFPAAICLILYFNRNSLNNTSFIQTYALFYTGLNDHAFYWELLVVNSRKVAFVLCASVIQKSSSMTKGNIGLLVLFI